LNEQMSARAIVGCIFILSGIILVQVFQNFKKKQITFKEIKINN